MDMVATRLPGSWNAWDLTDLLGRSLGRIAEEPGRRFFIAPSGRGRSVIGSSQVSGSILSRDIHQQHCPILHPVSAGFLFGVIWLLGMLRVMFSGSLPGKVCSSSSSSSSSIFSLSRCLRLSFSFIAPPQLDGVAGR
jgi:hypothetical protein